jgi:hypothetical protein
MARLKSLAGSELTLSPRGIEEVGNPTWIASFIAFSHKGRVLKSETAALTLDDLHEIEKGINGAAAKGKEFSLVSSDDNFIIDSHSVASSEDMALSFWLGEPYQLMTGYRFIVRRTALAQFAAELSEEIGKALITSEQ